MQLDLHILHKLMSGVARAWFGHEPGSGDRRPILRLAGAVALLGALAYVASTL